jgi:glycine/D-amino acid oxidase-like deaminating enzyme
MMSPFVTPVASDATLPDAVDTVVIGGGLIGLATAYALARKGQRVAVVEKGTIGAEQSSRNWGWCRQQNRGEREIPLIKLALQMWPTLRSELGADTGFRLTGLSYLTDREADLHAMEAWSRTAAQYGVQSVMMSRADANRVVRDGAPRWIGGAHCATDGQAEPTLACAAFGLAVRMHRATLHQQCAVRGLDISAGRVSGVITEKGRIRCQAAVVAAGAWSALFLARHGISLPQAHVSATAMRTRLAPEAFDHLVATPEFAVRRRADGSCIVGLAGQGTFDITPRGLRHARQFLPLYRERRKGLRIRLGPAFFNGPGAWAHWSFDRASPFEACRTLAPAADPRLVDKAMTGLATAFPRMAGVALDTAWGGVIDSTPDAVPVIDHLDGLPGLFVSTGYSGHGFGLSPAAGRLTADLVAGDTPVVDPRPFNYRRFVDGRRVPLPGMV